VVRRCGAARNDFANPNPQPGDGVRIRRGAHVETATFPRERPVRWALETDNRPSSYRLRSCDRAEPRWTYWPPHPGPVPTSSGAAVRRCAPGRLVLIASAAPTRRVWRFRRAPCSKPLRCRGWARYVLATPKPERIRQACFGSAGFRAAAMDRRGLRPRSRRRIGLRSSSGTVWVLPDRRDRQVSPPGSRTRARARSTCFGAVDRVAGTVQTPRRMRPRADGSVLDTGVAISLQGLGRPAFCKRSGVRR
jgi:hypothetical protein